MAAPAWSRGDVLQWTQRGLQREGRATGADNGDRHYAEVDRKLPAGRLCAAAARISARFGGVASTRCLGPTYEVLGGATRIKCEATEAPGWTSPIRTSATT